MASSQSYSDFERDYDTHLSKVRSFLATPTNNNQHLPHYASNISSCEQALHDAKQCIHAMRGLAEIEGDPFKAEEAKRKLERDIGPLEEEMRGRKKVANGGGGGRISSVFNRANNNGAGGGGPTRMNSDERYLFGNNQSSYAAPSMSGSDDVEMGEGSLTAPLTTMEQRMQDSEHLLRETQALCADSEQVGAATLETMGRQREQMERSSGLIDQSMENVQQARQIMKEMAHRALKNKMVLYCIIGLLVLANGGVIVHLWRRKK